MESEKTRFDDIMFHMRVSHALYINIMAKKHNDIRQNKERSWQHKSKPENSNMWWVYEMKRTDRMKARQTSPDTLGADEDKTRGRTRAKCMRYAEARLD
jgi:hypothetical protein